MKQRFLGALPSKFFWMMVSITRFTAFVAKVVRVSFSLGLSIGKSIEPDWSINMLTVPISMTPQNQKSAEDLETRYSGASGISFRIGSPEKACGCNILNSVIFRSF